jgi:hypothetical protein
MNGVPSITPIATGRPGFIAMRQNTNVHLLLESTGQDVVTERPCIHKLQFYPRLRDKVRIRIGGLHEESVEAVLEAPRVCEAAPEPHDPLGFEPCLLLQFPATGLLGIFPILNEPGGKLQCVFFHRRAVLADKRDQTAPRPRQDGDVIRLGQGVVPLGLPVRPEQDLLTHEPDPWREAFLVSRKDAYVFRAEPIGSLMPGKFQGILSSSQSRLSFSPPRRPLAIVTNVFARNFWYSMSTKSALRRCFHH